MTTQTQAPTNPTTPEHEKIFNEICSKLNELSQAEDTKISKEKMVQLEKMQNQMKSFHLELMNNHEEMNLKIEALENMTTSNSDLSQKVLEVTELLNLERSNNSKLSSDLARSLDLSLKLQLEIQDIKSKAIQMQAEDRKQYLENCESLQLAFQKEKINLMQANEDLLKELNEKETQVEEMTQKIDELEKSMSAIEKTSEEQSDALQHLMTVAENKIVEMKLSLDRVTSDKINLEGQHKQWSEQVNILKQENYNLKDYINKMTAYQQQILNVQRQNMTNSPS